MKNEVVEQMIEEEIMDVSTFVMGDFIYSIPENTDLSKYKIVNIWYVDFSVSFGTAELK